MWRTDAYFPCCPANFGDAPLDDYFRNIKIGAVFAYSDYDDFCPKQTVLESVMLKEMPSILVLCERADHKCSIVGISLHVKDRNILFILISVVILAEMKLIKHFAMIKN